MLITLAIKEHQLDMNQLRHQVGTNQMALLPGTNQMVPLPSLVIRIGNELVPVDPQLRVLKMGWNLSLIFMVDILSSGFCWWTPKALSCGPKLVYVGLKPLSFSLGWIGNVRLSLLWLGFVEGYLAHFYIYIYIYLFIFMALDLCLFGVDPIGLLNSSFFYVKNLVFIKILSLNNHPKFTFIYLNIIIFTIIIILFIYF